MVWPHCVKVRESHLKSSYYYSEIRCIALCVLPTSAFSVPSIILAETHVYLHEFKRSLFVIRDWWISISFVRFMFQGSLLCDRPVSGNNRLDFSGLFSFKNNYSCHLQE